MLDAPAKQNTPSILRRALDRRPAKAGMLERHPISIPALCFSIAWLPYVIIFFRSALSFGGNGAFAADVPLANPLYWLIFAFQCFVCVISHSLALRTMIGLRSPLWLIVLSIAFFCLAPMWGMLTCADPRHPLFAMMVCVFTSALAFIIFSPKASRWLWIQLALSGILIILLRTTGIIVVLPAGAAAIAFSLWKARSSTKTSEPPSRKIVLGGSRAGMVCVIAVVATTALIAALLVAKPFCDPSYGSIGTAANGSEVAHVVTLQQVEERSLFPQLAALAAHALLAFQQLPFVQVEFAVPFYLAVFTIFLGYVLIRRDVRAIIVGLPQIAILIMAICLPDYFTLRFIIPAIAAQVMFFAAALRGTNTIAT